MTNKEIVIAFFDEVYNKRNLKFFDEFYSKDYKEHREDGAINNRQAKDIVNGAFNVFPDLSCIVEDIVCEKDIVFVRVTFTGTMKEYFFDIPPTNKKITFEAMEQFKIKNGIITESWGSWPIHDIFY